MTKTPDHTSSSSKKDISILFSAALLTVLVHAREHTWGWLGSTAFWIIALLLVLFSVFMIVWLLIEIFRWGKGGFKETYRLGVFLLAFGLLAAAFYGMR